MNNIEHASFFDSFAKTDRRSRVPNRISNNKITHFHHELVERASHSPDENSNEQRRRQRDEDLHNLMARVNQISKDLHTQLTWSAVLEYKEAISDILHIVQNDLAQLETVVSRRNAQQHKKFVLIKTIDNKANEMITQFLRKEQDQLSVLALVGEVNGLLFDLQS